MPLFTAHVIIICLMSGHCVLRSEIDQLLSKVFFVDSSSELVQDHPNGPIMKLCINQIASRRGKLRRWLFLESGLLWTSGCHQLLMMVRVVLLVQPAPVPIDSLPLSTPNKE